MGKVSSKHIKCILLNRDSLEIVFTFLPLKTLKLVRSVCSEWDKLIRMQLWRQPSFSSIIPMSPNKLREISAYNTPPIRFLKLSQFFYQIDYRELVEVLLDKFELCAFEIDHCKSRHLSVSELRELFKLPISQVRTGLFDLIGHQRSSQQKAVARWCDLLLELSSSAPSRPELIVCNNLHAHLTMNDFRQLAASFRITQISAEFAEDFTEFEEYNQLVSSHIMPQLKELTLYGNAHYPDDSCTLLRWLNAFQVTHIHMSYLIRVDWNALISALQSSRQQQTSNPLTLMLYYYYGRLKTKLTSAMLKSLSGLAVRFSKLSTLDLELNDDNASDFVNTLLDINVLPGDASDGMIHYLDIDTLHGQYFGPQTLKQLKDTGTHIFVG